MNVYTQLAESMCQIWGGQYKAMSKVFDSKKETEEANKMTLNFYGEVVDGWEKAVENCIAAQEDWSQKFKDSLQHQDQVPEGVKGSLLHMQEANDRWRESRQQMWHSLFDMMRSASPGVQGSVGEEARKAFAIWQDATHRLFDSNAQAAQSWFNVDSGHSAKSGSQTGQSTSSFKSDKELKGAKSRAA